MGGAYVCMPIKRRIAAGDDSFVEERVNVKLFEARKSWARKLDEAKWSGEGQTLDRDE